MNYLKPSLKKIVLFGIFAFTWFSSLFLPDLINEAYLVPALARIFIFFPVIILKGILSFILGNGGDFIFTPGYVEVAMHILAVVYSYLLGSLLLDPSTSVKWNRIFRLVLTIFLFGLGTLFVIWQINPNYDPDSQIMEKIESFYGMLIIALACYFAGFWLIYKDIRTKQISQKP